MLNEGHKFYYIFLITKKKEIRKMNMIYPDVFRKTSLYVN